VEHANVLVAPELLPSEPESENNGKLTVMDDKTLFQMTAQDFEGRDEEERGDRRAVAITYKALC
jgi:hypothetical protein